MPPKKDKAKLKKGSSSSGSAEGPLVQLRPSEILYTYSKVLPYFSGCGRTLRHTLDEIARGAMRPSDLPAIAVISAEVPSATGTSDARDTRACGDKGPSHDGWSSDEDGGKRGGGKRGGGKRRGGGDRRDERKPSDEKVVKYFSTNNRRLWVLRECEARGLLGPEGTIGVRLQRPDVSKRMVEKGTRSFRLERCTDRVTLVRASERKPEDEKPAAGDGDGDDDGDGDGAAPRDAKDDDADGVDGTAVDDANEGVAALRV
jgi:hypothetical protein